MKTRTLSAYKQKGFSLLTGFILVIVLFGSLAFFLAGSGLNSGFASAYANTSKVSALLASASYVDTGFSAVTLGGTAPSAVTFDSTAVTGIFNPDTGAATAPSLDPSMFDGPTIAAGEGSWVYAKNTIALNGVGIGAGTVGDYTIVAAGLKFGICQQINNTLHGTALNVGPDTLTAFTVALLIGTPVAGVTSLAGPIDLTALGKPGWANGCYATIADAGATQTGIRYVYIHTLLAQ
jgi:hypothetical protein